LGTDRSEHLPEGQNAEEEGHREAEEDADREVAAEELRHVGRA